MEPQVNIKVVNPWVVKSVFEFNYFCCPECDRQCRQKQDFVNHAFQNHPESIDAFHEIKDGSLSDISLSDFKVKDEDFSDIIGEPIDPGDSSEEAVKAKMIQVPDRPGLRIEKIVSDPKRSISVDIITKVLTDPSLNVKPILGEHFSEFGPFHCLFCKEYFDSNMRLNNHGCASVVPSSYLDESTTPAPTKVCDSENGLKPSKKHKLVNFVKRDQHGFSCELCDFKVKSVTFLMQHVRRVHKGENALKCSACGEKFESSHRLKVHLWKEHQIGKGNEACLCSLCGKTIIGRSNFKKHERERHGIDNAKFIRKERKLKIGCLKCSTEFQSVLELNDHEAKCIGTESKNFPCNQCDLLWTSGHVLTMHMKVNHGMTEINPCDICGKILKKKISLETHKKVDHDGIKDHICHLCGRGFARQQGLQFHIQRVHENTSRYFCDHCDFKANRQPELDIHINEVHTKAIKFHCDECNFFCYRKGGLQAHVKNVHMRLKPHECQICSQAFVRRKELEKHKEMTHHN